MLVLVADNASLTKSINTVASVSVKGTAAKASAIEAASEALMVVASIKASSAHLCCFEAAFNSSPLSNVRDDTAVNKRRVASIRRTMTAAIFDE